MNRTIAGLTPCLFGIRSLLSHKYRIIDRTIAGLTPYIMMSPEWKSEIQTLDKSSENGELRFVELVDQAINKCDLETSRILLRTFTRDDDFGVQEAVVSALSTADLSDY